MARGINGQQCAPRASQFGAPVFSISGHIASATGTDFTLSEPVPFNLRVISVVVICRAASAGATVQLYQGSSATPVSNAIAAVAADTYYGAGTLDDTYCHFRAGSKMGLAVGIGAGTNDFDVYVLCIREDA